MKGDGTIGTIVQWLMSDLHVSGIESVIRRYVCDSMAFHRNRRYFFSDRILKFNLTANRRDYKPGDGFGLPADLVEIASRRIWILVGGSEDTRQECERSSTTLFEESVAGWGTSKSQPDVWDFRVNTLRFSPTPTSSTDIAELRYITNIGIPRVTWDSVTGTFAFYHPTTGENITSTIDDWTNDWTLQESGAHAIRNRTKYMVQKNYLKDKDGAADTLADWLESVGQLEDETEGKTAGVTYLEGTILD